MKRFKFKLQKLLDLRERREREVQNELSRLLSIQNREKEKQEELKSSIEQYINSFQDKLRKGIHTIPDIVIFERYVDVSTRAIDVAQERIDSMEPEIMKVREKLIEASREKKVVEKLKDKRFDEYNYKLNREIMKENDDVNQNIFIRKRIGQAQ